MVNCNRSVKEHAEKVFPKNNVKVLLDFYINIFFGGIFLCLYDYKVRKDNQDVFAPINSVIRDILDVKINTVGAQIPNMLSIQMAGVCSSKGSVFVTTLLSLTAFYIFTISH